MKWFRLLKTSRKAHEFMSAGVLIAVALSLYAARAWVFEPLLPGSKDVALWHAIFSDRATIGLVRMVIVVVSLYALASVGVLVSRGQWLRAISTSGIEAETATESDVAISRLEEEVRRFRQERDDAWRLVGELIDG